MGEVVGEVVLVIVLVVAVMEEVVAVTGDMIGGGAVGSVLAVDMLKCG